MWCTLDAACYCVGLFQIIITTKHKCLHWSNEKRTCLIETTDASGCRCCLHILPGSVSWPAPVFILHTDHLAGCRFSVSCKDDGWWIYETMRREVAWLELVAIEGEVEKNNVCLCNVTETPIIPLAAGGWDGRRSWDWSSFSVCWLPSCLFFFFESVLTMKSPSRLCCKMNKNAWKCAWKATLQGFRHIKWVLLKQCSLIRLRNISSWVKQEKVVIQSLEACGNDCFPCKWRNFISPNSWCNYFSLWIFKWIRCIFLSIQHRWRNVLM